MKIPKQVKKTANFIKRRLLAKPLTSFLAGLALVLVLIIVGNYINNPKSETKTTQQVKKVTVYHIGQAPRLSFQAKIEKKGVITIASQTGGVVQNIYHKEGELVDRGSWLVGLSTNYGGANIASVQRQLAEKQFNNLNDTYATQKEIIAKQRDLANQNDQNNDQLRSLTDKALSETRDQLAINEDILNIVNDNLTTLENATNSAENKTLILQTKQLKSQYQSAVNQLKAAIRSSEYQVDEDNPPSKLSDASREIALKQLELQEKALDLSKEVSSLSLKIAQISESLMYPATPFSGRVEKIYVRPGQLISAGTPLVLLSGNIQNNVAFINLSSSLAKSISKIEGSVFTIGGQEVSLTPAYVSQEATEGQLYSAFYNLPAEFCSELTDGQYLSVSVPIGYADTGSTIPYVPIDAVSQTEAEAVLYLAIDNKAEHRQVKLGNVFGRFVEITEGLENGDVVILDRTVVSGDSITYE